MGKRPRSCPSREAGQGDDDEFELCVCAHGTPERLPLSKELPPGPKDLESLFNWPAELLQTICERPAMSARLVQFLAGGVVSDSDYSGMDSHREVCFQLSKAMDNSPFFGKWEKPSPRFGFQRSCDWASMPQEVLVWIAREVDLGKSCVFPCLESRLPEEARQFLGVLQPEPAPTAESMKSSPDSTEALAVEQGYADTLEWLLQNSPWLYNKSSTSPCLVHGGRSPRRHW